MVNETQIELNISELVFHGFAPAEAYRIKDAMERELNRLFSTQGVSKQFSHNLDLPLLNLGKVQSKGLSPESMGAQLANTVFEGLTQPHAASIQPGLNPTF